MSSKDIEFKDVCIVNGGSVDSGKSTTVGVLVYGTLDDGNGSARVKVAKHPHEIETTKTSDISTRSIRVRDFEEKEKDDEGHILTLIDLCGHEKYYGTTARGMGQFPDFGMITVAANKGILTMTRQHILLMILKKLPFFIVITKIDIAPRKKLLHTFESIEKVLKNKLVNRIPEYINKEPYINELLSETDEHSLISIEESNLRMNKDILQINNYTDTLKKTSKIVPVICISNKTGHYVDYVREFISNLKPRQKDIDSDLGSALIIDSCFKPPGQGLIVSGIMKGGDISVKDSVFIGPRGKEFIPAVIRSIHYDADRDKKDMNKKLRDVLPNHARGTFALGIDKKYDFDRKNVRSGMVVIKNKESCDKICFQFKAEILIVYHKTMIREDSYTPFIHINTIAQSAKLVKIHSVLNDGVEVDLSTLKDRGLRMGDTATVSFRFIGHPEFVIPGSDLMFREGSTVGSGKVIEITRIIDDLNPYPAVIKKAKRKQVIGDISARINKIS
jgi:elongation factor 1-alpha